MKRKRRNGLLFSIFAFMLFFTTNIVHGQSSISVQRITFSGTLGANKIGMVLLVDSSGVVTGGHYFYAKYLKDISLKAGTQGAGVVLYEPGGGQFALNFRGKVGKPLNFHNSIGLEGRWMKGDKFYPVALQMEGSSEGPADARWYEDVTSESDATFEAKVQDFYRAVLRGDRTTAARFVDFPLHVNHKGKSRTIRSATELSAQWERIFTAACIDAFKNAMPHDLFVRNGQVMLGNGVAWFGAKGAQVINVPYK